MAYATGRCMCHPVLRIPFEVDDVVEMVRKVFAGRVYHTDASLVSVVLKECIIGTSTDYFRDPSCGSVCLKLHLPQSVTRGHVSLGEIQIEVIVGKDVRYLEAVVDNSHFILKSFQLCEVRPFKIGGHEITPEAAKGVQKLSQGWDRGRSDLPSVVEHEDESDGDEQRE
jgi:hypothetical protein